MGKRIYWAIFGIIFIIILGVQFRSNYILETSPPSKEWSKEYKISDGKISSFPKIIKIGDKNIAAHDDGEKIKILILDNEGKIKNQTVINAEDRMIRDFNLLHDGKNIYANWIITENGSKIMKSVTMDLNLKEIKREQILGVEESSQIDDSTYMEAFKDKINIINLKDNKTYSVNAKTPGYLAGTKTDEGYFITYMDKSQVFNYFTIYNGAVSDVKEAGAMTKSTMDSFGETAVGLDKENAYILVETRSKGAFGNVKCFTFKLDEQDYKINDLKVKSSRYLYSPIGVSSGDKARFIAGSERKFGKKDEQYDVVDFSIKNGEIVEAEYLSRTKGTTMLPAIGDGIALFCDFAGDDNYKVYLTSQNEDFKKIVNGIKGFEVKNAIARTINGIISSVLYIFVIGARWILLGGVFVAIFTFISYSMQPRRKKIIFILIYLASQALKIYMIYDIFYRDYAGIINGWLASPYAGIFIQSALGALTLGYAYGQYRNDLESMPVINYTKGMAIDAVLTLMIFVPFLV